MKRQKMVKQTQLARVEGDIHKLLVSSDQLSKSKDIQNTQIDKSSSHGKVNSLHLREVFVSKYLEPLAGLAS